MSRAVWSLFLFLFASVASVAHAQADAERVRIHGSQTLGARLVPAVAQSWLRNIGYESLREVRRSPNRLEIHAVRDAAEWPKDPPTSAPARAPKKRK